LSFCKRNSLFPYFYRYPYCPFVKGIVLGILVQYTGPSCIDHTLFLLGIQYTYTVYLESEAKQLSLRNALLFIKIYKGEISW